MKPATEEQVKLLQDFLSDNKIALNIDVVTNYPNGVAHTSPILTVVQQEEENLSPENTEN